MVRAFWLTTGNHVSCSTCELIPISHRRISYEPQKEVKYITGTIYEEAVSTLSANEFTTSSLYDLEANKHPKIERMSSQLEKWEHPGSTWSHRFDLLQGDGWHLHPVFKWKLTDRLRRWWSGSQTRERASQDSSIHWMDARHFHKYMWINRHVYRNCVVASSGNKHNVKSWQIDTFIKTSYTWREKLAIEIQHFRTRVWMWPSVKSDVLTLASTEADSSLETASSGHSRNCTDLALSCILVEEIFLGV